MKKITLINAGAIEDLAWPESGEEVTLDSPALEVFTDFTRTKPLVIDADTKAVDTEKLMQKAHVRLKVVVDHDTHFLGIISLQDLNSQQMLIKISAGEKREELSVVDFMQPRNRLEGLAFSDLSKASIMEVIEALKDSAQQHCIVVDNDQRRLRGIISASDIVRKLRLSLNLLNNSSFSEVYTAVQR